MKKIFLFLLVSFSLFACNKPHTQYHRFKTNSWQRFDKITFDIPVTNAPADYDLYFHFRHNNQFSLNRMPLFVTLQSPNSEERVNEYKFTIKDNEGNYKGNGMGDIWDNTFLLRKQYTVRDTGIYHITFENMHYKYETPGVIEIGVTMKPTD